MKVTLAGIIIALSYVMVILGQIPQTMSYQGVLTDANGNAIQDGGHNFIFRIYEQESGGNPVWEEAQLVQTSGGLFEVALGQVSPLNLPFDRPYFLGISVDGGDEMSPRVRLTAAPYSLNAQSVVDGAVTANKIASGQVVKSVNNLKDNITLSAGENITISANDNTITISATGGEGGLTLPFDGITSSTTAFQVTTSTTAAKARAISGIISTTSPGGFSTAIRGENRGTGGSGIGVYGSQDGYGWGVYGTTPNGIGVYGSSTNGTGVYGASASGHSGYFKGKFRAVRSIDASASLENHVAIIENNSSSRTNGPDVLAIKSSAVNPGASTNFITFFDGNDKSLGAIQGNGSGGVTLAGPGNDYAEWLPLRNPAESVQAGDIVAWTPRGITLHTRQALYLMVVSTQPIVTGNAPMNEDRSGWAPVAFVGQVLVRVRGQIQAGDFILPSGKNDGSGVAVAVEALQVDQVGQVVGRALESAVGQGLQQVKVLVGLPQNDILRALLVQRDAQLAAMEARIQALERALGVFTASATK